jgi:hypothetical protein
VLGVLGEYRVWHSHRKGSNQGKIGSDFKAVISFSVFGLVWFGLVLA